MDACRGLPEPPIARKPSGWNMNAVVALVLAVVVPEAVGALSGVVTARSVRTWYVGIAKPGFTPPSWVFAPVWTSLYLLMGVASWLVWRQGGQRPEVRVALLVYGVHLVLNGAWSLVFFGAKRPGWALAEILVLDVSVVLTALLFLRISRLAGGLMVPYVLWVAFATALNGGIWWLNRGVR